MPRPAFALIVCALTPALLTFAADASVVTTSTDLPPIGAEYTAAAQSWGGGAVVLSQARMSGFGGSFSPPGGFGGTFVTPSFGTTMEGDLSFNGAPLGHPVAPGQTTWRLTNTTGPGVVVGFDTEMLQLDLAGGSLPPGVLVRESPTLFSMGQTTITSIGGGQFRIDSFFDVFTELSTDGGQSWIPSDGAAHFTLFPSPGAAGLLALGGVFAARRRRA